jgi:hypothetical protein
VVNETHTTVIVNSESLNSSVHKDLVNEKKIRFILKKFSVANIKEFNIMSMIMLKIKLSELTAT